MLEKFGEFIGNYLFDIFCYCIIIYGVFVIIFQIMRKLKCNTSVKGIVREYEYKFGFSDSVFRNRYYPIYEYKVDDIIYTKKSRASYSKMKFSIGSSVDLLCNKNYPNQVIMPGDFMRTVLWIFLEILFVGGKIFKYIIWR